MKVIVASLNPIKIQATLNAFKSFYPDREIVIETLDVDSGVSPHPTTAEESIQGALNRAEKASFSIIGADYYVGIEGGLIQSDSHVWEIGWVAIRSKNGQMATGLSSGVEMKGKLLELIKNGTELSQAIVETYNIESPSKTNGFYGLVTDDRITRESSYKEGVIFALSQFAHPEYFN
jgi:inosine/xanthosine triphosphatase